MRLGRLPSLWRRLFAAGVYCLFFPPERPPGRRRTPPTSCGCFLSGGPEDQCRAAALTLSSPDVYDGIHMQGRAAFCRTALYRRSTAASAAAAAAAGGRPSEGRKERRTPFPTVFQKYRCIKRTRQSGFILGA